MPEPVLRKLEQAFLAAMDDEAFKKSMSDLAVATVRADAAGARKQLEADVKTFGDILKSLKMGRYAQN